MTKTFIEGCVRSIVRGSDIPPSVRLAGFNIDETCHELVRYVQGGQLPADKPARLFVAPRKPGA